MERFGIGINSGSDSVPLELTTYFRKKNHKITLLEGLNFWTDNANDHDYRVSDSNYELTRKSTDEILGYVLKENYDVIHSHTRSRKLTELNKKKKESGVPLIHTVHGRDELTHDIALEHMKHADLITTPSRYVMDEIRDSFPEKNTIAVPNSTHFTDYKKDQKVREMTEDFKRKLKTNADEKIILCVGRLQEDKGIYETGEAVTELIKEGYNIKLVHAGPAFDVKEREILENKFKNHPSKLEILGFQPSDVLPSLYKAADIFVLPSDMRFENMPVVGLETLAMETPLIVSDIGGPKEAFVDPGFAIGVRPRDKNSIKEGIRYVFDNYNHEKKRAEVASQVIERYYHTDKISDVWLNIYRKLSNKNGK
ncbi:MAG: glycosyltransferase family 4 protein [Candidatus Aenigmatarchaeota archaeon]